MAGKVGPAGTMTGLAAGLGTGVRVGGGGGAGVGVAVIAGTGEPNRSLRRTAGEGDGAVVAADDPPSRAIWQPAARDQNMRQPRKTPRAVRRRFPAASRERKVVKMASHR